MKKSHITLAFLILLSTAGCVSHGVMVSDEQVNQIKRGETTEAQLVATLGRPTTITTHNGQRMYIYSGVHAQARPASFIPIIGPLVGGADVKSSSVIFRMTNGIVTDVTSSQSTAGSGQNFAARPAIEQTPDQPR